jgi:hypothetical protein
MKTTRAEVTQQMRDDNFLENEKRMGEF